jgi:hypothetical protein
MIDGPMTTSGYQNSAERRRNFKGINADRLITGGRQKASFPSTIKARFLTMRKQAFILNRSIAFAKA